MSNLPALVFIKETLQGVKPLERAKGMRAECFRQPHDTQIAETTIGIHLHWFGNVRWLLQWLSSADPVACDPHSGQSRPDAWQRNMDGASEKWSMKAEREANNWNSSFSHHSYDHDLSCFDVPECSFNITPSNHINSTINTFRHFPVPPTFAGIRHRSPLAVVPGCVILSWRFSSVETEDDEYIFWIPLCELPSHPTPSQCQAFLTTFFGKNSLPKNAARFLVFHHSCDHGCRPPQVAQQENLVVMVCHCNF